MEWYVDGISLGLLGESVSIDSLSLAAGEYSIQAKAYDSILDHSFSGNSLDWWRLADTSLLEQSVSWSVIVSVPEPGTTSILGVIGLAVLSTRRRKQRHLAKR